MNLNEALIFIDGMCESYINGSVDVETFRESLETVPAELWQDNSSVIAMVRVLAENDDLYDMILETDFRFMEFVCNLLPKDFWSNKNSIIGLTDIYATYLTEVLSSSDFRDIFKNIPDEMWNDSSFGLSLVEIVAERQAMMEWGCWLEDLFPDSFLENNLYNVTSSFLRANQINAVEFGLIPSAAWNCKKIIFLILSNLEDALKNSNYHFTMYPTFRRSNRDYLERMFEYIPQSFKSDVNFILEVLKYDYFYDAFDFLYEWMDEKLWENKEFVLSAWELDEDVIEHVSDKLSNDEDIKKYIEENIDVEWILECFPNKKIPQWIKELSESF